MRVSVTVLALWAALSLPGAALAHPHIWVSGGADFGLDDEGRLARLHVTWVYDEFASLYMLNALGADADGDRVLTDEDKAKILDDQTNWHEDFEGDSYLFVDGARRALGDPQNADTRILETGQVEVTFERAVLEPFRPTADTPTFAKVYDPYFYYAYEITSAPTVIGPDGHGCTAEHRPYDENDPKLKALEVELSALGTDETPDQADVGALFADELRLTCE